MNYKANRDMHAPVMLTNNLLCEVTGKKRNNEEIYLVDFVIFIDPFVANHKVLSVLKMVLHDRE